MRRSRQPLRFHPAIQRVKEIIDSGELGTVTEIHAALCFPKGFVTDDNIRMNYDIGGGALMDCGCKYRLLFSTSDVSLTSSNRLPAQLCPLFGKEQSNRCRLCVFR